MKPDKTGDGSLTLHSERYGQTFHSHHGAVAESKHVFIENSGIGDRLRAGEATSVLEVGFGTGLNCWMTADLAVESGAALEIMSLEQDLLQADVVRELRYGEYLNNPELLERYLTFRDSLPTQVPPGEWRVQLSDSVSLVLRIGRAEETHLPEAWADAVYHDAFSPDANAELWSEDFLAKLLVCLKPGGLLVTYSVKGDIRRRLESLGFDVSKKPGPPGGKREMLVALKDGSGL